MKNSSLPSRRIGLFAMLAACSLLSACSITITEPARDDARSAGRLQISKPGSARFECVQSPTGECHYALYTSRCQTATGEGGKPATTCTHQVFEEFTIAQGQIRDVGELPSNFKQCMRVKGKPVVPGCD